MILWCCFALEKLFKSSEPVAEDILKCFPIDLRAFFVEFRTRFAALPTGYRWSFDPPVGPAAGLNYRDRFRMQH